MITHITELSENDIKFLKKTWRGKRIYSYYKAYGGKYDFCRFYKAAYEKAYGVILIINATFEGSFEGDFDVSELCIFIEHNKPFRIQLTEEVSLKVYEYFKKDEIFKSDYLMLRRTIFEISDILNNKNFKESDIDFNPSLDDVYKILNAGFPNLLEYSLWLTDTSHRIRHGVSHVFTYKNCTTATILFDIENSVVIGQVATLPESRGKGYAREFLMWMGSFLKRFNKTAILYALDMRRSFYCEIGFKILGEEHVLERSDRKNENTKGEL